MNKSKMKKSMMSIINYSIINLPTPPNLGTQWNFGSMLGMMMIIQTMSGIVLSMHYNSSINLAFESIIHIIRDVNYGWMIRTIHSNGASMVFIIMYMHIIRGIYFTSYLKKKTWYLGMILLMLTMATAFMGYVLPWGQMSFWGATVITNLISAIPYLGDNMVKWIWGGFSVENPTLNRFFSMHFTLPFLIIMNTIMHLYFLHENGSTNPTGLESNSDKIPFNPYYSIKDMVGFSIMLFSLFMLTLHKPYMMSDPDNFIQANPMITPKHIQPEWYFLFAYTILRSIPNKLGGVMALMMSILILSIIPNTMEKKFKTISFYPISQSMFWMLIVNVVLLTWLGMKPAEEPYTITSMGMTLIYFSYFIMSPIIEKTWEKMIK